MIHFNIQKNAVLLLVLLMIGAISANAQLSGSYTIGGTNPDYSSVSDAVSDLGTNGVSGAVTFNIRPGSYSTKVSIGNITGASTTNTITFRSSTGIVSDVVLTGSGSSSANYIIRLSSAKYFHFEDMTLTNTSSSYGHVFEFTGSAQNNVIDGCIITGHTGNTTSSNKARIYAYSQPNAENNTIKNCRIEKGSAGIMWRGSNTSTTADGNTFIDNEFVNNYYYGIYSYYCGSTIIEGNTFTRTGSGTYNSVYVYYHRDYLSIQDNHFDLNTTGTTYAIYTYFANYYSNNTGARPVIKGNNIDMVSKTNQAYAMYNYYPRYMLVDNNDIDMNSTSTSGYQRFYGLYYGWNSKISNNDVKMVKSGGYQYNYAMYYGYTDTCENNNFDLSGNSYIYQYFPYYVRTSFVCRNNIVNSKTTNRTIYGLYHYYGENGQVYGNKINCESNTGTIYGVYAYRNPANVEFYNNTVVTKTGGSNYTMRCYYPVGGKYYNNTFHSNSTGSTNYTVYLYNSSSTYSSSFRNNVFSRVTTKGYVFWSYYINSSDELDYNNYYAPGGNIWRRNSPGVTTSDLANWRSKTNRDNNSLSYEPGYTDAAAGDLRPDASNPSSWSLQGRGVHIAGDTMDMLGNARAKTPADGVPDLGAYEFTPTSIPPAAAASPAAPAANSTQKFTFGQDEVGSVDWGASVPSSVTVRQYTGLQANPIAAAVGRMFFFVDVDAGGDYVYDHTAHINYKDPWIGDVSSETNSRIAKSSAGGDWQGYNYTNGITDTVNNILSPAMALDSLGSYTGVENARIGIRCVPTPENIAISNITAFVADINWDPIYNPIGYEVIIDTNPGTPASSAGANFTATNSFSAGTVGTPSPLIEDTKYYVHIRSICGPKDTSGWALDSFTTLITCHDPNVTVSAINANRAVASWDTIKTAVGYEYVINQSPTPPAFGTTIPNNSLLVPYLLSGTTYYIHVRTECSSIYNNSGWTTVPFSTWSLGIGDVDENGSGMSAYPNPVQDVLHLQLSGNIGKNGQVELLDVTGKVIKVQEVSNTEMDMEVSSLSSGVYMVRYRDDERTEMIKITKQ